MADTPETTQKAVKILVVEDSATQLAALRFLLEGAGFSVVTATNGREGLAAAKANAIDLVISDIVMPEMDGYALCKALRANEALRHLPVILLTSLADPRDVIHGLESGANNFICKPYNERALLARVNNVLANQEIRKAAPSELGISIFFAGQRFFITADRLQILDLLLSTYENAVNHNTELVRARDELRVLNEQLETRVAERTAELTAEVEERKRGEAAREKLEEQLRMSQKMEAIGGLAGGIAHDFNNLLSVILSYTGFAMDALQDGDPLRDDLLEVMKAGDHAAALTRQLLAFSRKQVLQPEVLDLNRVATRIEKMLRRILGEDIDFVQVLAPDLGAVRADPGQIEQVLMNLAVNARDAMPEGGKLTIETANVEIDEEYASHHVAVKPGSYIELAVTDTGCGMDEQTRAKIFDPFFTTKGKDKGTGLGLSTVYGIVKQSGGNTWVYSELGHGTTFKIQLPRELSAAAGKSDNPPAIPRRTTGTETILVVEDERALRKVTGRTLEAAGYAVLTAANGDEALEVSARRADTIHLLLTDVIMPRMSGRALAHELAKTRSTTKVLYMSGYTDNAIVHHGVLDAGTHFIGKPFTAASLARKVRDVLDGDIADLADRYERTVEADAGMTERPLDKDALRALPPDVSDRLVRAAIAARYDEIIELVETIRATEPEVAAGLRRMADLFDYDGLRNILSP
ncbi:MAG: response regulator [Deltaproteobacteria bacterium]|nr:response regulator [Deltaproteobacteria bacterium]